jgi:hypothetical protein
MANMQGLDAEFRRRFELAVQAVERELGVPVSVVSAYRSAAEQARLYDAWVKKQQGVPGYEWANLAAPPGRSNHERGLAIDITPNSTAAMRNVFARYGLTFPVKGEPWHVEPITARGGVWPPLDKPKPAPPVDPEGDDMPLNDADKAWIKAAIAADNEAWTKHLINHVNGTGDSIVKRVLDGLTKAVKQITG